MTGKNLRNLRVQYEALEDYENNLTIVCDDMKALGVESELFKNRSMAANVVKASLTDLQEATQIVKGKVANKILKELACEENSNSLRPRA